MIDGWRQAPVSVRVGAALALVAFAVIHLLAGEVAAAQAAVDGRLNPIGLLLVDLENVRFTAVGILVIVLLSLGYRTGALLVLGLLAWEFLSAVIHPHWSTISSAVLLVVAEILLWTPAARRFATARREDRRNSSIHDPGARDQISHPEPHKGRLG